MILNHYVQSVKLKYQKNLDFKNMKIIKAIKLQRKFRIRQEVLCDKVCTWSYELYNEQSPYLNEYMAVNKAVKNVNNKLPIIYFILSDIFGGSASIKRKSQEIIKLNEKGL